MICVVALQKMNTAGEAYVPLYAHQKITPPHIDECTHGTTTYPLYKATRVPQYSLRQHTCFQMSKAFHKDSRHSGSIPATSQEGASMHSYKYAGIGSNYRTVRD